MDGKKITSLHAEVACLKNIKIRKKYRLLVLKYNKKGLLVDSKPCSHCKGAIMEKGFKEVYYSTGNEEEIVKTKMKDLKTRESKSQKQFKIHGFNKPKDL
jgi:deoxycytidylate deaminase